jgi:hypothetical protein
MAVTNAVQILAILEGLGELESFADSFSTTTTITYKNKVYKEQATADTEEAVPLGGVTTPHLVIVKCIANDVDIDPSYTAATFRAGITIQEGEFAVFMPAGSLYFKNNDAGEKSTIEVHVWGI